MNPIFRLFLVLLRLLWRASHRGAATVWRWLSGLLGRGGTPAPEPASSGRDHKYHAALAPLLPESASPGRFSAGVFKNEAGQRDYKLFLPGGDFTGLRPLLVMLHGCKQNPDDFAIGTRMNELAQKQGCLVLYPGQSRAANGFYCWNWFHPRNQQREGGEPAILAGMIRELASQHGVDPQRIYAAGLSAGAAMAVTLAHTHPELLAAVGAHSGLPHGAASNMISALVVMKRGAAALDSAALAKIQTTVPLIVFQGDRDTTVHPRNGVQLMARAGWQQHSPDEPLPLRGTDGNTTVEQGQVPQGHSYTRTCHRHPDGKTRAEHWLVHGAGHAWSGGNSQGSYTDPQGPDASTEFLRFFLFQSGHSLQ